MPSNTSDPDPAAITYIYPPDPEVPLALTPSDSDAGKFTSSQDMRLVK